MKQPLVSVIIPTYGRAFTLKYAFEGLKGQTYKNFEVVVVFKPGSDETEKILKDYSKDLPLRVIIQKDGFITGAYNLGLKKANGEIIAFLDDDAVPYPNWLEEHVKTYNKYGRVGGVSGPAVSAIVKDGRIVQVPEDSVYPYSKHVRYYDFPWSRPLTGTSDWLIYFGKDGLVHHRQLLRKGNFKGIFPSLLFMGANMSVRRDAIEGLRFDESLILGFACEQRFSYQIWRRGYKVLYNPNARVLHIIHSESLGRFFQKAKRAALRDAEFVLTFPFLRSQEKEVSLHSYVLGIITLIVGRVLNGRNYGFSVLMHRIYGLLYGSVVGCAFIISNLLGGKFSIRNALVALY